MGTDGGARVMNRALGGKVVLGFEEELGDDEIGACSHLLDQEARVVVEIRRLGMTFGVRRDADRVLARGARVDQPHQLDGMLQSRVMNDFAALGDTRRGIPPEREDVLDSTGREGVDRAAELVTVGEHGRQMRDRGDRSRERYVKRGSPCDPE